MESNLVSADYEKVTALKLLSGCDWISSFRAAEQQLEVWLPAAGPQPHYSIFQLERTNYTNIGGPATAPWTQGRADMDVECKFFYFLNHEWQPILNSKGEWTRSLSLFSVLCARSYLPTSWLKHLGIMKRSTLNFVLSFTTPQLPAREEKTENRRARYNCVLYHLGAALS